MQVGETIQKADWLKSTILITRRREPRSTFNIKINFNINTAKMYLGLIHKIQVYSKQINQIKVQAIKLRVLKCNWNTAK